MDWARILAYITGTVDQELLLRNSLGNLRVFFPGRWHSRIAFDLDIHGVWCRGINEVLATQTGYSRVNGCGPISAVGSGGEIG